MSNDSTTGDLRNVVRDANKSLREAQADAKRTTREYRQAQKVHARAVAQARRLEAEVKAAALIGKVPSPAKMQQMAAARAEARHAGGVVGGLGRSLKTKKVEVGTASRTASESKARLERHVSDMNVAAARAQVAGLDKGTYGGFDLPKPTVRSFSLPSARAQSAAEIVAGGIDFGSMPQHDAAVQRIAESIDNMDATGLLVTRDMMTPSEAIMKGTSPDLVWHEVRPAFTTDSAAFPYKGTVR